MKVDLSEFFKADSSIERLNSGQESRYLGQASGEMRRKERRQQRRVSREKGVGGGERAWERAGIQSFLVRRDKNFSYVT